VHTNPQQPNSLATYTRIPIGVLTGAAIALFQAGSEFQSFNVVVLLPVVFASALSTLLQIFLGRILVTGYGVATFTLPFHFVTWAWLLAAQVCFSLFLCFSFFFF
jgi:urea transporter